jgi:hypothetical protein
MFAILIATAKEDGQVDGLIPHLIKGGVSILQYADDPILFMDHDLKKTMNIKLIISVFEQLLGLKNIFHKSELFGFDQAIEMENDYIELLGCEGGALPLRYLGIPIHYQRLNK